MSFVKNTFSFLLGVYVGQDPRFRNGEFHKDLHEYISLLKKTELYKTIKKEINK